MKTLVDMARHQAATRPDAIALVYANDGRAWTFGELDIAANRFANRLIAAGIKPGDRVAYLDKNTPEYLIALLGGAKAGAVSVAVNWRLSVQEMNYVLNNSESRLVLVGGEYLPSLAKMDLAHKPDVVVIGDPGGSGYPDIDSWIGDSSDSDPMIPVAETNTAMQLYTSGTTGFPKGAEITHANLMHCAGPGHVAIGIDERSSMLVCLPMFHIGGSGWVLVALFTGAKTVLLREADIERILDSIQRYRITHGPLVPTLLRLVLRHPRLNDFDLSSLTTVIYGASPNAESDLQEAVERFSCRLVGLYGLSETTGSVTLLAPEDHVFTGPRLSLLRSSGKVIPNHEIKIVDVESGQEKAAGEVGEIWIRGPQVMKGYWKNSEATAAAIGPDGWLRTGDAGCLIDGYIYIRDRVKDMIISGGENIYPAEIENVLMKHEHIADVAVIGVPSERWGETAMAVVARRDERLTKEEVIEFCRQRIATYKCPTCVEWIDAIPRSAAGKILKVKLREQFAARPK